MRERTSPADFLNQGTEVRTLVCATFPRFSLLRCDVLTECRVKTDHPNDSVIDKMTQMDE